MSAKASLGLPPPSPATKPKLRVGSKVEIIGERGLYLVSHIDRQRHLVDVLPFTDGEPQRGLHITAIRPMGDRPLSSLFARDRQLTADILGTKPE